MLNFTTYTGEVSGLPLDPGAIIVDFEGLQQQRVFYKPQYDTPQQAESRLPDLRHLLFWSPDVKTDQQGKTSIEFYTSDLEGDYMVVIEGISQDGKAGFRASTFTIKNTSN